MADEERDPAYHSSPPSSQHWGPSPHIYPHSSHGTPSQEYHAFPFNSPPIPMDSNSFGTALQQRPAYPQLQPLFTNMPPWPSMLGQNPQPVYQPVFPPPPPQPVALPMQQPSMSMAPSQTPISATSSRSMSTPRKTLTDADRKNMCQYAEDHPNSKQTEIGAVFGVERSTVSKVLRQKEKYLLQDEGNRSPIKRPKGRSPDIERALVMWARNEKKKNSPITDESIRERLSAFSRLSGIDTNAAFSASWIEKFKLRNNIAGARSRKSSLAPDDSDLLSMSQSLTQSPQSSPAVRSPSPNGQRRDSQVNDMLKTDSPSDFFDFGSKPGLFHTQSTTSLNSAFIENASSTFSPGALSPTSSFFTSDAETTPSAFISAPAAIRPILPANFSNNASANAQRPRSQTFPLLDQYMSASGPGAATAPDPGQSLSATAHKFPLGGPALDSPMEEADDPLGSIGVAIDMPDHHAHLSYSHLHAHHNPFQQQQHHHQYQHHQHQHHHHHQQQHHPHQHHLHTSPPLDSMRPPPLPPHVQLQHDAVLAAAAAAATAGGGAPGTTTRSSSLSISPTNTSLMAPQGTTSTSGDTTTDAATARPANVMDSPSHARTTSPLQPSTAATTATSTAPTTAAATASTSASTSPTTAATATTPEEARKAMQVVLSFFEQQPAGFLDLQESLTMGKLMEKLNLQSRVPAATTTTTMG